MLFRNGFGRREKVMSSARRGPVSGLSVQLAVLTSARPPAHPSGGLIQNKRIKKRREQKNAKTKQGKMTTFV